VVKVILFKNFQCRAYQSSIILQLDSVILNLHQMIDLIFLLCLKGSFLKDLLNLFQFLSDFSFLVCQGYHVTGRISGTVVFLTYQGKFLGLLKGCIHYVRIDVSIFNNWLYINRFLINKILRPDCFSNTLIGLSVTM